MDYFTQHKREVARSLFIGSMVVLSAFILIALIGNYVFKLDPIYTYVLSILAAVFSSVLSSILLTKYVTEPVNIITKIVSFAAHNNRADTIPDINTLHTARELVQSLSLEIYNLASTNEATTTEGDNQPSQEDQTIQKSTPVSIFDTIGLPVIGVDGNQAINVANKAAGVYLGIDHTTMVGKQLYDVLKLSFQSDDNLDTWLKATKTNSVTASKTWERVRHTINEDSAKQFDMVASYSRANSSGTVTMLALFDRTVRYNREDQEVSFVALAVHELRTPLTIMRGYIEVFEDELGPTLNPELTEFMHKMHASAQQLAAFVSNILNVARIEENQLSLKLRSEDWATILKAAVADLALRAGVHGIHIELQVTDNLPPIAADRISAHEIVNNLVDNAIKYSDKSEKIVITAQTNSEGLVETSIQDFGIGIPTAVMGELFQKFHRSHKSRVQVGGTGLGLFLCKALVQAHGGNIWARSKEGEGSIFTFTLLPYDRLSKEDIDSEDGIIRGAHGWIKNHSLYRG